MNAPRETAVDVLTIAGSLWSAVGGEAAALDRLTIVGDDPVLPSVFPVARCAAATVAVAALAGAEVMRVAARHLPSIATLVMDTGRGKRSTWLDSLDRIDALAHPDPGPADVADLMREVDSEFGRLAFVGPAYRIDGVDLALDRPPVPLGTHSPRWSTGAGAAA